MCICSATIIVIIICTNILLLCDVDQAYTVLQKLFSSVVYKYYPVVIVLLLLPYITVL